MHLCRLAWLEFNGHDVDLNHVDDALHDIAGTCIIDAKSIYDTLTSQNQPTQLAEKRTALEFLAYLKNTAANNTQTRWVHGGANLADGLTKLGAHPMLREFLEASTWCVVNDPKSISGKKRQAKGLKRLESGSDVAPNHVFDDLAWQKLSVWWPNFCDESESADSE